MSCQCSTWPGRATVSPEQWTKMKNCYFLFDILKLNVDSTFETIVITSFAVLQTTSITDGPRLESLSP